MPITTVILDAYGTLFDVAGAARLAAAMPDGQALRQVWPRLAEDWRRKQLEYTWQRTITGDHTSFDTVTADALDWAMEAAGIEDIGLRARLLAFYDHLPPDPEVRDVLEELKCQCLRLAILSNGTPAMLDAACHAAGIRKSLTALLSVEAAGVFKPDARVYALVSAQFGCAASEVLFVSSNGWDVAGAAGYGFRTVWINRAGLPQDRLPHRPQHVLADLAGLPLLVLRA